MKTVLWMTGILSCFAVMKWLNTRFVASDTIVIYLLIASLNFTVGWVCGYKRGIDANKDTTNG